MVFLPSPFHRFNHATKNTTRYIRYMPHVIHDRLTCTRRIPFTDSTNNFMTFGISFKCIDNQISFSTPRYQVSDSTFYNYHDTFQKSTNLHCFYDELSQRLFFLQILDELTCTWPILISWAIPKMIVTNPSIRNKT